MGRALQCGNAELELCSFRVPTGSVICNDGFELAFQVNDLPLKAQEVASVGGKKASEDGKVRLEAHERSEQVIVHRGA
jgi:hypothetical protein